jgi:multiple sugar transport system substrate-binding protein
VSENGRRFGLPKDFDTVAIFYNKKMVADAGLTEEQMHNLEWNPRDGGSYEKVIARLTVDEKGVRGDEPGFDKDNVAVHGLGLDKNFGGIGQTQYSMYTGSNGWQATDKNPWGTHYRYDEPAFQETIRWWRGLIEKGYMPPLEVATSGVNMSDAFGAGKSAMNTHGSWMVSQYFGYQGIDVGLAPTPIGPTGKRASMYNGLADAIYAGSTNQEAAWQWVKFLGSPDCQRIVASHAIVFPAIPEATEIAVAKFADKGIDVRPFTVHIEEGTTLLAPITDHIADINAIMMPAMDGVVGFDKDPSALTEANQQVNAYFEQDG